MVKNTNKKRNNELVTCYVPFIVNNPYALNVKRLLSNNNITCIPIKSMLRNPMLFKKCKIINLNWFEKIDNTVQYLEKVLLIKFLKVMGKKIIYNFAPALKKEKRTTERFKKRKKD